MDPETGCVAIVDDDDSLRRSLSRLLRSYGWRVQEFQSAADFLNSEQPFRFGCILLDVCMPEISGLDFQQKLAVDGNTIPVIFLTGHGDIPMSVQAIKKGASDFLTKPVDETVLLAALRKALEENRRLTAEQTVLDGILARIRSLSPRELEVLRHVIAGELNKQIGGKLGIAEKTVKVHRARVMEKMGVRSVAELVRFCSLAKVEPVADPILM